MPHVITQSCCNDASCVPVCPVDCIRPRPGDPEFASAEQLYIDPDVCIDCGACVDACPVGAAIPDFDLLAGDVVFEEINADYFQANPLEDTPFTPPTTSEHAKSVVGLRVAIVGSGPAGLYAAAELSGMDGVEVAVIDRLPTPFGLVRAGVAPDHARTKRVANLFQGVLARPNVHFFGNVEVGTHVTLSEVANHFHAVIWATGAAEDKELGIDGEELTGSVSAREFVGWYNGHPDLAALPVDLSGKRIVVIGNGNVALDIARVLTKPTSTLVGTDIAAHALETLEASMVEEVVIVGRRGPEHASFTTSELLSLSELNGVDVLADLGGADLRADDISARSGRRSEADGARRVEFLRDAADREASSPKRITLRFGLTPKSVTGERGVEGVRFEAADGSEEVMSASMVIRAVGYRTSAHDGLPYDDKTGTIPHRDGRVWAHDAAAPGLYCTGWAKRGPSGFIGTNRTDAIETVSSVAHDFASGLLADVQHDLERFEELVAQRQPERIDFRGWQRINAAEIAEGKKVSRPRVKFVSVDQLFQHSRR